MDPSPTAANNEPGDMTTSTNSGLKVRRVAIDTFKENVAYLHRDCVVYRSEGFQALSKIDIESDGGDRQILATLNVVDDASITTPEKATFSNSYALPRPPGLKTFTSISLSPTMSSPTRNIPSATSSVCPRA